METNGRRRRVKSRLEELPIIQEHEPCSFEGYDALSLMSETAKLRKLITKRGTLEIGHFFIAMDEKMVKVKVIR